jgi:hypothetical protein
MQISSRCLRVQRASAADLRLKLSWLRVGQ